MIYRWIFKKTDSFFLKKSPNLRLQRIICFSQKLKKMYFLFSTFLIASSNAQSFHTSWKTARHTIRNARSGNSSDQNSTGESWIDGLSDGEILFYQNFALSSKLYPNTLDVLLKAGIRSNPLKNPGLKTHNLWRHGVHIKSIFSNYNKLVPGFIGEDQSEIFLDLDLFWLDFMSPSQSLFSGSIIFNINWQDDRLKWNLTQLGF